MASNCNANCVQGSRLKIAHSSLLSSCRQNGGGRLLYGREPHRLNSVVRTLRSWAFYGDRTTSEAELATLDLMTASPPDVYIIIWGCFLAATNWLQMETPPVTKVLDSFPDGSLQ